MIHARPLVTEAPQSEVTRITTPETRRMTRRIWNLDWSEILPWDFEDVRVSYGTFEETVPFIRDNYPRIFNTRGAFYVEETTEAKRRFAAEMDFFVFRHGEQIVGVLGGHPSDWTTYYWRTVAFLPEFRAQRLLSTFAERCYEPFRAAGVDRMEVDTCPGNNATMRLFTSQGFIVTSTLASERWGFSVRFTKFLNEKPAEVFRGQFLDIPV